MPPPVTVIPIEKKLAIMRCLPSTREAIGRKVGFYRLNEFIADLAAVKIICFNETKRVFELYDMEIVEK